MRAAPGTVAGLVAAVTLVSVAAAGPTATRQRAAMELTLYPPPSSFAFIPQGTGPLERDKGRIAHIPRTEGRTLMRDGQRVMVHNVTWTLHGKHGTLVIRERTEWVFLGRDGNGDRVEDAVAFGTWKVVEGTGQYARIVGGGRSAHAGLGDVWNARHDGFLTVPSR